MMDDPPATTTTTTPSSAQHDSSHRTCANCKTRISTARHDAHTVCIKCRGFRCDHKNRCNECEPWTKDQMDAYLKHRKSLDVKAKSKAKTPVTSVAETTPVVTSTESHVEQIVGSQDRLASTLESFFNKFLDQGSFRTNPSSFAAPLSVPDYVSRNEDGGGNDGPPGHENAVSIGTSPAVHSSKPKDSPLNLACVYKCQL